MSSTLYALGRYVCRHWFSVLAAWGLMVVVIVGLAGVTGGKLVDNFTIPSTESQRGIDTLARRFPQASGTTGQIVFTSKSGPVRAHQDEIEQRTAAVAELPHVTSVDDPFAKGAVGTISADQRNALVQVQFDVSVTDLPDRVVPAVERAATPPPGAGFATTLGGAMYTSTGVSLRATELVGVAIALVVLTITFSSLPAGGLPLVTAALGAAARLAGILTLASFTTVSSTTPTLALMIGLAVGIDYGLFILVRHRRQLAAGMSVPDGGDRSLRPGRRPNPLPDRDGCSSRSRCRSRRPCRGHLCCRPRSPWSGNGCGRGPCHGLLDCSEQRRVRPPSGPAGSVWSPDFPPSPWSWCWLPSRP